MTKVKLENLSGVKWKVQGMGTRFPIPLMKVKLLFLNPENMWVSFISFLFLLLF